ncbi:MAG: hypothetical protein ABR518_02365 [Actinomycetota bacterium]
MPTWLTIVIAVVLFVVIGVGGMAFLRGIAAARPKERIDPEDVEALDVYFVCAECGTEYQVTRLGEIQVPRHCGEPMAVARRPRQDPLNN